MFGQTFLQEFFVVGHRKTIFQDFRVTAGEICIYNITLQRGDAP